MAARRKGAFTLDEVIETTKTMPVDARQLVRSKEEMLDPESFPNGYNGMIVGERTESKLYMLMDKDNPTLETSWKVIGPYDDSALDSRVTALENAPASVPTLQQIVDVEDGNAKVTKVTQYDTATNTRSSDFSAGSITMLSENTDGTGYSYESAVGTTLNAGECSFSARTNDPKFRYPRSTVISYGLFQMGTPTNTWIRINCYDHESLEVHIDNKLKGPFRAALGITDSEELTALTDEEIAELVPA